VTNDELQEIDALLSRRYTLPHELAQKLREQLASNAVKACAREKRIQDLERECAALKAEHLYAKAGDKHWRCRICDRHLNDDGYCPDEPCPGSWASYVAEVRLTNP
jgi:hypothetical protein